MQTAWLKDTRFDLGFIAGIALIASAMSGITILWPALFLTMLAVHSWAFGYEHLWATYTKLFGHAEDRSRHLYLLLFFPIILFILYLIGRAHGMIGLYVVYFFGQFFHTVRQSWGLAQEYRRQAGGLIWDSRRLSEITLWSIPIWGFLYRCNQRPDEFLFQDFWLPPVSRATVIIAAITSAILWLYWMYSRVKAYRRRELALGHTLYMISHALIYLAGYILIDELCSGWLLVNVWHNVQYIAYVWFYHNRRFASGVNPHARTLSWLTQRGYGRLALYCALTLAFALPVYYVLPLAGTSFDALVKNTAVPAAITVGLSLTFHHYLIDSLVWRRGRTSDKTHITTEPRILGFSGLTVSARRDR